MEWISDDRIISPSIFGASDSFMTKWIKFIEPSVQTYVFPSLKHLKSHKTLNMSCKQILVNVFRFDIALSEFFQLWFTLNRIFIYFTPIRNTHLQFLLQRPQDDTLDFVKSASIFARSRYPEKWIRRDKHKFITLLFFLLLTSSTFLVSML